MEDLMEFPLYTAETSRSYQLLNPDISLDYHLHMVAVDPGGEHVGVAAFGKDDDGWECVWAGEMTPLEFEDWLSEQYATGRIDILVYESWKLFPDKAKQQTGSDMPTSQLIGVIKYIHRACKSSKVRFPGPDAQIFVQDPSIKIPTRSLLKARGMLSMAKFLKIPLDHAADAELHGWHLILKTLNEPYHQTLIKKLKAGN